MGRPVALTKFQRCILVVLRGGELNTTDLGQLAPFGRAEPHRGKRTHWAHGMLLRLADKGFVERAGCDETSAFVWTITDRGREALQ